MKRTLDWLLSDDDDLNEPGYDPVHLGGVVVVTLTAMGCLYWLLWTLLVFEGGIGLKAAAFYKLAFTSATLKDLGYEGYPYAQGAFEGWIGNVAALLILSCVLFALVHLDRQARQKAR